MNIPQNISFSHEDISKVEKFAASQKSSVLVIFFDDIKGSSLIKQEMARKEGEEAFQKLRKEHDQVLSEIIMRHGTGEVIKSTGDGLLAVFTEPTTAVEKALEIQAYYRNHPYISLRIGMDMGQVRVEKFGGVQKDMFGRHVDWASRAESMADGGHILVTESVYNDASDWVTRRLVSWKTHGYYFLKPGERPFALFEPYNANITEPMDQPRGNKAQDPISEGIQVQGPASGKGPSASPGRSVNPGILVLILALAAVVGLYGFFQVRQDRPEIPGAQPAKTAVLSQDVLPAAVAAGDFSGPPIPIGCDTGQASQTLAREGGTINWTWKDKKGVYCGWFLENQAETIFSSSFIKEHSLEIIYSGQFIGTPSPQVKFIDTAGLHTKLLTFSDFEKRLDQGRTRVLIPLVRFVNWSDSDEKKMQMIQFDAGWDSPSGDVKILSIRFLNTTLRQTGG